MVFLALWTTGSVSVIHHCCCAEAAQTTLQRMRLLCSIKHYLWTLRCKRHIISTCHEVLVIHFFQIFKDVKNLISWTLRRQVASYLWQIWPVGRGLPMPGTQVDGERHQGGGTGLGEPQQLGWCRVKRDSLETQEPCYTAWLLTSEMCGFGKVFQVTMAWVFMSGEGGVDNVGWLLEAFLAIKEV